MLKTYSKPPLSYTKQVDRLISRGLTINSTPEAEKFLRHVSYYRFSAYRIPFQKEWDVCIPGTTFSQIHRLYELDEALRDTFLHVLTAIEIFLRTHITHELTMAYGAFAHYSTKIYRNSFNHEEW